jgi:RNA polymerase-binding transcription factor DksA
MYTTTRNIAGGTFMTCKDCGDAISMNKLCENPIQSATNMLKHIAQHSASKAFTPVVPSAHASGDLPVA